jgi:zinc transporter ZupT
MIIASAILWYISGIAGFVYWWTSEFDLESPEIALAVLLGLLGPITFVMGYIIHKPSTPNKIFMKKRNSNNE